MVPPFYYAGTPNPYQWDTLVHCGDTVAFDFIANDNDYYPNGTQQNLLFEVSGGQFYNYNDGIPCQNPPCATFEESITGATPPFSTANGTGTGQFEWITSCNHVINNCSGYSPSVYTFVVRVDNGFEYQDKSYSLTVNDSVTNITISGGVTIGAGISLG